MVHPQRLSLYTVILKGTCYIGFEVLDVQEYMNTFTVNSMVASKLPMIHIMHMLLQKLNFWEMNFATLDILTSTLHNG